MSKTWDPQALLDSPIYAFGFQVLIGDVIDHLDFSEAQIEWQLRLKLQEINRRDEVEDCVLGKASGKGRWVWRTVDGENVYEGNMRAGKLHGWGSLESLDGSRCEGEWRDGKANGTGAYTWPDGHKYEGEWRNEKRRGQGTLTFPDGGRYESQWRDDIAYGRGKHTNANGVVRTCLYRDGKLIGCQ